MFTLFTKIVDTLFPNLPVERIKNQLRLLQEECLSLNVPIYRNLSEDKAFVTRKPFRSRFGRISDEAIMKARYGKLVKGPLHSLDVIYDVTSHMPTHIEIIIDEVNKGMGKVLVAENLTYSQATLLHLLELVEFFLTYSRRFIIHLLTQESKEVPNSRHVADDYPVAVVKWLEYHMTTYITVLSLFSNDKGDFRRKIASIPEIKIEKDPEVEDAVISHAGENTVDPFKLGFIPYTRNPFYMFGAWKAEYDHDRLERARVERELVGLRLEEYIQLRDTGSLQAVISDTIEKLQTRIQKLDIKINELEESFTVHNKSK